MHPSQDMSLSLGGEFQSYNFLYSTAIGIDKTYLRNRDILCLWVLPTSFNKSKEIVCTDIDNPCNNLEMSPLCMLHPLGSSLGLAWPDAIKGYGEKYGDNSFESVLLQIFLIFTFYCWILGFTCFNQ